jgi:hypothetical protein
MLILILPISGKRIGHCQQINGIHALYICDKETASLIIKPNGEKLFKIYIVWANYFNHEISSFIFEGQRGESFEKRLAFSQKFSSTPTQYLLEDDNLRLYLEMSNDDNDLATKDYTTININVVVPSNSIP